MCDDLFVFPKGDCIKTLILQDLKRDYLITNRKL